MSEECESINISNEEIQEYFNFVDSPVDFAIKFVRNVIRPAKNSWIEIISYEYIEEKDPLFSFYDFSKIDKKSRFKRVECNLYARRMTPKYHVQFSENLDQKTKFECNLITWHTGKKDIENQKKEKKKCENWIIELSTPEMYMYRNRRELSKTVDWKGVSEELKDKLRNDRSKPITNDIAISKGKLYIEVYEKYLKDKSIFKNNKISYSLQKNKELVYF